MHIMPSHRVPHLGQLGKVLILVLCALGLGMKEMMRRLHLPLCSLHKEELREVVLMNRAIAERNQ